MNSNITFIIAAYIDCAGRQDNLDAVIKHIDKNFKGSQIVLVESDVVSNLADRYNVEHVFIKRTEVEVFNKMKLYNAGARKARSSVLCFVDADMPPSKSNIVAAYNLIVSNTYDIVLPYGKSEGYNIPKEFHAMVMEAEDVSAYDETKHPWLSKQYRMEYMDNGGIVLFNTSVFFHGGGGNEYFVGWGCEDDEMISRFVGLGYRLGRLDNNILVHLQHPRNTSTEWYDYSKYEKINRQRLADVRNMSREDLSAMVMLWNNFDSVIDNFKDVTVIISGSYLDSHPRISYMQEVIESLPLAGVTTDTRIILVHDALKEEIFDFEHKQKVYAEYFQNLKEYIESSKYTNIEILKTDKWGHLTRSLRKAVSSVTTKYMLVLQHDIHIRREIPVNRLISLMEKYKNIKHLRFNTRKNHPLFMWWDGYTDGGCIFSEKEYDGIKLCITPAWSDQNHISTREYYETVVFPDCTDPNGELMYDFMENKLNRLSRYNHDRYGTYVYGEFGAPRTSRHSDGRKSSPEKDED